LEGKAIIFSAPSGSGKTTIVQHLLKKFDILDFSISACSRPKRPNEQHARDYYFLSLENFKSKIQNQEFIEWEEVYTDNYYGTLKSEIDRIWQSGKHVVFDVDVKGGLNLKKYFGDKSLSIFVKLPSIELLEHRLRQRGTESEEKIKQRIEKSRYEVSFMDKFDKILENNELEVAFIQAENYVKEFIGIKK